MKYRQIVVVFDNYHGNIWNTFEWNTLIYVIFMFLLLRLSWYKKYTCLQRREIFDWKKSLVAWSLGITERNQIIYKGIHIFPIQPSYLWSFSVRGGRGWTHFKANLLKPICCTDSDRWVCRKRLSQRSQSHQEVIKQRITTPPHYQPALLLTYSIDTNQNRLLH